MTLVQVFTRNDALALIFPWRLSTWLVPVSVGLIVGKLVILVFSRIPVPLERIVKNNRAGPHGTGSGSRHFPVLPGKYPVVFFTVQTSRILYVKLHRQPGQVILIPSKLYDFRLETGAPIYVDFLSIPYQSAEVVEWDRRFRLETYFYQRQECNRLSDFSKEGVTQVVLPIDFPVECPQLVEIYRDSDYSLYNISRKKIK